MSLYEPLPQADLSPQLPNGDKLTWREIEDYGHLFVWVFWRPHSLTSYLRKYRTFDSLTASIPDTPTETPSLPDDDAQSNGSLIESAGIPTVGTKAEATVEIAPTLPAKTTSNLTDTSNQSSGSSSSAPYQKIEEELYLLAFCLTQILVAFVSIGYWAILTFVSILNNGSFIPLGNLVVSLIAGVLIVFLIHVVIRLLNAQMIREERRTDMAVAAMVVLGLVGGITAGIYFLDSLGGDFLFRVALVSSGVGAAIGLMLSTLTYYIKIETNQRSFMVIVFTSLFFIVGATLFGGLLTRSLSFMWVALLFICLSFIITSLRFDDWLLGQILKSTAVTKREPRLLPRVTPIPIIGLRLELEDWLDWDWETGLKNIRDIRTYTRQDPMTSLAIRQILKESSEEEDKEIVSKVEQLQSTFDDIDLRHFSPARLSSSTSSNVIRQSVSQLIRPTTQKRTRPKTRRSERLRHRQQRRTRALHRGKLNGTYAEDSLADAAIAGYSYLQLNHPDRAIKAFGRVTHDGLGKEMVDISKALNTLWFAEKLPDNAPLELPKRPSDPNHEQTWNAFTKFQNIVRYVWLLKRSREENNFAAVSQLILDTLAELKSNLPDSVEGIALGHIAADWEIEAANLIDTVEHTGKVKQIENPYIFAEPLSSGSKALLKGRKEQLELIKAAWRVGNFQPTLIYGQRHMGKTSLIRCADAEFSTTVRMAYVNLRQLAGQASPEHLFLTICDAVGELRIHSPPTQEQLFGAPYREFRQFIHECASRLGAVGLVIVLDELEHLADDIERSDVLKESIQQLWTLSQLDPNLGVILITTRNPSELMDDNDQSLLTSSVQPIEVGYLTRKDIAPLLRSPTSKFLPYCTDKALDRILFWTSGQPFLTQLLAYYLIEHYNAQVSALEGRRDPLFTPVDIDATVQRDDFRRQCQRYFQDILLEAIAVTDVAIDILDIIAEKRMGATAETISESLSISTDVLTQLEQHQILRENNGRWQIIVELFRWWLRDRSGLAPS